MTPRPLLVVLASVFAGLAVLLVVSATVTGTPLVLLAAVPLALTAGLMWYQGTGRLAAGLFGRGRRRRTRVRGPGNVGTAGSARTTVGGAAGENDDPWEDPFREEAEREARYRDRRQSRRTAGDDGGAATAGSGTAGGGRSRGGAWRQRRERADRLGGLTTAEAYDVLGLDRTASDEEVRAAYREQAKTAHPDTDGGSAEEFQKLNDAYERIVDE